MKRIEIIAIYERTKPPKVLLNFLMSCRYTIKSESVIPVPIPLMKFPMNKRRKTGVSRSLYSSKTKLKNFLDIDLIRDRSKLLFDDQISAIALGHFDGTFPWLSNT